MLFKNINTVINHITDSLVKFTGLSVFALMAGLLIGCGHSEILYDYEESQAQETETWTEDYHEAETDSDLSRTAEVTLEEENGETYIVVHLCGAVNNPGVYELDYDSRVIDGIVKAGGFADDASEDTLNLASKLQDGSRVYIPTVTEAANMSAEEIQAMSTGGADSGEGQSTDTSSDGLININTASADKLTSLPGIGDTRAAAIIAYREEYGAFGSIEEIMNVSGIKEGSYSKIKDLITVN